MAHALLPVAGDVVALDVAMIVATTAGLPAVLAVPLLRASSRAHRRALLLAYACGLLLALALQVVTARPRPGGPVLLPMPALPSFPSGHAMLVAIAVGFSARARDRLAGLLAIAAIVVAVSRVHVGHHFPTDVLGGIFVGAPIGVAAHGLAVDRDAAAPRLGRLLGPQIGLVAAISLLASVGGLSGDRLPLLRLPGIDKVLHLVLFGLLALLACLALGPRAVGRGPVRVPLGALVACAIACIEELAQVASPHRTLDALDLLGDFVGILVGARLSRCLGARKASAALGNRLAGGPATDPHRRRVETSRPDSP